MKKNLKKLWIEALRSGKYKQGKYRLSTDKGNAFRCLGVFCDVYAKNYPNDNLFHWDPVNGIATYEGVPSNLSLPRSFKRYIELDIGKENVLIDLNDDDNATFAQIANQIEKNL